MDKTESARDSKGLSFSVRVVLTFESRRPCCCHPGESEEPVGARWVPAFAGMTGGRLPEGRKSDCPVDSRLTRLPGSVGRKARGFQLARIVGNRGAATWAGAPDLSRDKLGRGGLIILALRAIQMRQTNNIDSTALISRTPSSTTRRRSLINALSFFCSTEKADPGR